MVSADAEEDGDEWLDPDEPDHLLCYNVQTVVSPDDFSSVEEQIAHDVLQSFISVGASAIVVVFITMNPILAFILIWSVCSVVFVISASYRSSWARHSLAREKTSRAPTSRELTLLPETSRHPSRAPH